MSKKFTKECDLRDVQDCAPLFDHLVDYIGKGITPLHTPAHKGRHAAPELGTILTTIGLGIDLPAMQATDNTFHPRSCIALAQSLAASYFKASETIFLT